MGRGRPKKVKVERDYGTPELRLKRLKISPDDTSLSTTPMDVMLARQIISPEEHAAGARYLLFRVLVFGRPHISLREFDRIKGPPSDEERPEIQRAYEAACDMLLAEGRGVFDAIQEAVIYQIWPKWLLTRAIDNARGVTKRGFEILADWRENGGSR